MDVHRLLPAGRDKLTEEDRVIAPAEQVQVPMHGRSHSASMEYILGRKSHLPTKLAEEGDARTVRTVKEETIESIWKSNSAFDRKKGDFIGLAVFTRERLNLTMTDDEQPEGGLLIAALDQALESIGEKSGRAIDMDYSRMGDDGRSRIYLKLGNRFGIMHSRAQ